MVDLALSSMALAVFSRTQRHPPAATEASSRYHRLLQVAQERVSKIQMPAVTASSIDACLLAAFLMGRYEGVIDTPRHLHLKYSLAPLQRWSHYDGIMAILKFWYDKMRHEPPTFIAKHTRRQLIKMSLLRKAPLPGWILDGHRFGERGLERVYDRIIVRIVNLSHSLEFFQPTNGLQDENAKRMNIEAFDLDRALQDWVNQISSIQSYHSHDLTKFDSWLWPGREVYSSIVYTYSKPECAAIWVEYFAARLLVNNIRSKLLDMSHLANSVNFDFEEQRLDCITTLKAVADSLASSIPFCLGKFEANGINTQFDKESSMFSKSEEIKPYLVNWVGWPLTVASSLKCIDIKQQLWFRAELASLGGMIGDSHLECAGTKQWVGL